MVLLAFAEKNYPDLRPMGSLVAAALQPLPDCDLLDEKSWLFMKLDERNHEQRLYCSLCAKWCTSVHRLSERHQSAVASYGNRNQLLTVKQEQKEDSPGRKRRAPEDRERAHRDRRRDHRHRGGTLNPKEYG